MKKLAILAAAAGIVAGAQAQTFDTSFSLRGGIQFPTTADLNGTFWGVGADVNLIGVNLFKGGQTYVSVDWISKNLRFNRNFIIPIALNQRFALNTTSDTMTGPSTYAFAGLGVAIIDIGNAATTFMGRVGLGADFSSNVYGEAALVLTGRARAGGAQGNHLGVWLGYRF